MSHDVIRTIDIAAPPEKVGAVMRDVERWHEWTASVRQVKLLNGRPLRVGSRAMTLQPKLPPAFWKVTAVEEGPRFGFTWVSWNPGMVVTAGHYAEAIPGGCRATLSLHYEGLFGGLLARVTRDITVRYVDMEAEGLKRRSENR